jgi:Excalibur calcium-binding domain
MRRLLLLPVLLVVPSQAAAQAYFDAHGGSPSNNVDNLDADHDGKACEAFAYGASSAQQSDAAAGGTLLLTRYRPHHLRR